MSWDNCTQQIKHSKIKLDDPKGRRHAIFHNPNQTEFKKTAADGCWIVQKTSADWVITCCETGAQVIVELKGTDTNHATEQILATARELSESQHIGNRIAGLIVCTQYPSIDTKIQRARLAFKRLYNAPIHVVTKSREFDISRVICFSGPG